VSEPAALIEDDDRWLLPYRGMQVDQICVSYQLSLVLDGGAEITVEAPALLTVGSVSAPDARPVELVPERQDVAAAMPLFGTRILSSVAFKSGSLRVVFDSGLHLSVEPDPAYEAWGVTGPLGMRIVCMPGGGLAGWTSRRQDVENP
jgi:hypothetical protein